MLKAALFKLFLLVILLFALIETKAQVKLQVTVPANTPDGSNIYLAGNFNNWHPGEVAYKLTPKDKNIYEIVLPASSAVLEFKFTRGSWETIEITLTGSDKPNRSLSAGATALVALVVENWADLSGLKPEKKHTASVNVRVLRENFAMLPLNRQRRIWIYLPPGYETSQRRYPVLYLHDGQNLFDDYFSFSGEWGIDEALDSLYQVTGKGLIAVGIDNGGESRLPEYSPWKNLKYGGGEGEQYTQFIVQTLKPYIDQHYRTRTSAKHTGMMGSSMGGLISFYAGARYPQVFSRIGIFSPAFWFSDSVFTFAQQHSFHPKAKILLLAGAHESKEMVPDMQRLYALIAKNRGRRQLKQIVKEAGKHNEQFWRREFPAAVQWLFKL